MQTNTIEGAFLNVVTSFDVFQPNFRKVVLHKEEFAKKWSLRLGEVLFICRCNIFFVFLVLNFNLLSSGTCLYFYGKSGCGE